MSAYKFRVDQPVYLAPLSQSWTQQGPYKVTLSSGPYSLGNMLAHDIIVTDLEIAVLCDLLNGPDVSLRAHKRAVLDQLRVKGLVEPVKNEPEKVQLNDKAYHLLSERGVSISGS
jgi:hypothetical protein